MKKFVIKLLLYLSPVIFLLAFYIYKDPFKVLYHYNAFYKPSDTIYFDLCDDYISTQTLIQNYPEYKYDSYIFGSSRSENYMVSEFSKHVNSNKCYHYFASYESLYGLEKKFQFLNQRKYKLDNALIIVDNELLRNIKNDKGHIRIKHPLLSGQNMFSFQLDIIKDFFDKDFLLAYLDFNFSGRIKPYMVRKDILRPLSFHYDVSSNETRWTGKEAEINNNSYYEKWDQLFYKRDSVLNYAKPVIGAEQRRLLNNIKLILSQNHTNYKIVISPLYNQLKLDTTDLKTLQNIFNKDNVFDFSGINDITNDKYNYYETSHYRPKACAEIMNVIYKH